ncbi:ogr/Delta-like zinc finger family protein [Serratia sp. UGAL515B_01]|uniref:ogr/Delta-like zinc finger family protein n=1 Tax=Serratia sp. UGAL515B_01 TaxID=2986763 RepID=UPI003986C09E
MKIMYPCPACHHKVKTRSSRILSDYVKERYYRCHNTACLCAFKTYECFEHFITKTVDPHIKPVADIQGPVKPQSTQSTQRYSMRLE